MEDNLASLYPGVTNVLGRAIVVHAGPDDLGLGNHDSSMTTGNAGGRVGCGVIEPSFEVYEAEVNLLGHASSDVEGQLKLKQVGYGGSVHITGKITGLSPGKHGFHVHALGGTGNQCKDAGGHYNPLQV